MSHTVTVTRTTTTTTTSAIILNTGYLRTWAGILKLCQLLLGIVIVTVITYYRDRTVDHKSNASILFFLLMAVTFLIGTFLLLLSCLVSISTASIISKTIYEVIYHSCASALYLAAAITLLVEVNNSEKKRSAYRVDYDAFMATAILGLIIAIMYLLSTIFAQRSYRGL